MTSEPTSTSKGSIPGANPLGKISAISLFVEDVPAAKTFYTTVFGVPVIFEDEQSCVIKFENLLVNLLVASEAEALVTPAAVGSRDAGRRFQISIWVDNLEHVVEALLANGVNILTGPQIQPWGMKTATFVDPAGHSWEVGQQVNKA